MKTSSSSSCVIQDPHRQKKRKLYDDGRNPMSYTAQKQGKHRYQTVIISNLTGIKVTSKFYIEFPLCLHIVEKNDTIPSYENTCPVCFKFQNISISNSYCIGCHQSYRNIHDCSITRPACLKNECKNKVSPNNFGYCKIHMNPTIYAEQIVEIMDNYLILDLTRYVLLPYLNVYTDDELSKHFEYATPYEKMQYKKRKRSEKDKKNKNSLIKQFN